MPCQWSARCAVEPFMAWRDHMTLEVWRSHWSPDDMVSAAECEGAAIWESALMATRRALRRPLGAKLEIAIVFTEAMTFHEQHGTDRYVWRRNWAWVLPETRSVATLMKRKPEIPHPTLRVSSRLHRWTLIQGWWFGRFADTNEPAGPYHGLFVRHNYGKSDAAAESGESAVKSGSSGWGCTGCIHLGCA